MNISKRTTINIYSVESYRAILSINGRYYITSKCLFTLALILRYAAHCRVWRLKSYPRSEISSIKKLKVRHCIIINDKYEVWMDGRKYRSIYANSSLSVLRPGL